MRSPIEQAEREEAIADWLADHGLDIAIAEPLAETAVTFEALDRLAATVDGPALERRAAVGVRPDVPFAASHRRSRTPPRAISGLVAAIKGFTHMDQAAVAEPVDLTPGSRATRSRCSESKARSKIGRSGR